MMNKTTLFTLFLMILPTSTWAEDIYPIKVHVLVEGEPARVYPVRGRLGKQTRFRVHPHYWVRTALERQPDGLVTASVTLSTMPDGPPSLSVSTPLEPAEPYDASLLICKNAAHVAAVGGASGKIAATHPALGQVCKGKIDNRFWSLPPA